MISVSWLPNGSTGIKSVTLSESNRTSSAWRKLTRNYSTYLQSKYSILDLCMQTPIQEIVILPKKGLRSFTLITKMASLSFLFLTYRQALIQKIPVYMKWFFRKKNRNPLASGILLNSIQVNRYSSDISEMFPKKEKIKANSAISDPELNMKSNILALEASIEESTECFWFWF